MTKREKRLSIPTLNRLNEEDENVLVDNQDSNTNNFKNNDNSADHKNDIEQNELAIEKKKLIQSIDGVFKLVPFCQSTNLILDDQKRLESLEQALINRLILGYHHDEINDQMKYSDTSIMLNKLSSSQYGIYLASSFESIKSSNSRDNINKNKNKFEDKESVMNLNNLNLTSECLNKFSATSFLSKAITNSSSFSADSSDLTRNEDYLNLINNSKKIRILNLTNNSLKSLPIQLINMFENLELINLSENNFETINLVSLVKFSSLKEINLSNNYLKSFKAATFLNENDDDDDDQNFNNVNNNDNNELSNSLFVRVERLDLANNQLKSSNCLVISKFRNLKYLNLSNNFFQINGTSPESQLPWFKSKQFKNLIELNLSKNNKYVSNTTSYNGNTSNLNRNLSSLSLGKGNIINSSNSSQSINTSNYNAYTSFKAHNDYFYQDKGNNLNSSLSPSSSSSSRLSNFIFSSFNCLTNLRKLDLSENNLINMPNDIKDLKYLEELNLNHNKLMFIPNELTELKQLKYLLLNDNNLTELNDSFCTYANFKLELVKLDLSKNQIIYENFSSRIGLFENLKELNLSENLFDFIPNTLPKNLEYLNLNSNKIKSLMTKPMSEAIYHDNELLEALNMDEISKRKAKNSFKSSILSLRSNSSKKNKFHDSRNGKSPKNSLVDNLYDQPDVDQFDQLVMPHVFFLRNLKILHLRNNHIQEVPSDFGILNSNLEFIDLSSNLLTHLNVSLCRGLGNSLRFLDLSSNKIRELSDKLRELGSVEYLNLSHNRIEKLNFEICNDLKSLKELYLNHNNIEELPVFSIVSSANNDLNEDEKPDILGKNSNKNNINNPLVSSASSKRKKFSFNLPNLIKIDLSHNKLKETFSIYSSFAPSQNLIEINLSSNRIKFIELQTNEKSNVGWAIELLKQQKQNQQLIDDVQVKQLRSSALVLKQLKIINLSNNDIRYLTKGGFIRMLCDLYKLAPNLDTFLYDQSNGAKLGEPQIIERDKDVANELKEKATLISNNDSGNKKENNISVNGSKINNQEISNNSVINDDFYFDFDEYEADKGEAFGVEIGGRFVLNENKLKGNEYYDLLLNNLRIINLSNNNLKTLPKFLYDLNNLKEIYFNGNLLTRIPNEMYKFKKENIILEDDENFENLKELQELRIRAENEAKRKNNQNLDDPDEEMMFEEEREHTKSKKISKSKKKKQEQLKKELRQLHSVGTLTNTTQKLLSDTVEIIHFNSNKIEHVPEDLFSNFKHLKEIKLLDNPLKEPPLESVCISSKFVKNKLEPDLIKEKRDKKNEIKINKYEQEKEDKGIESTTITLLNSNSKEKLKDKTKFSSPISLHNTEKCFTTNLKDESNNFSLPNLFFETNENLKPLQSYMIKYKNREDMLLCNMFLMVKDNIDSTDTLMKLMRRLKMPMDRVNYVCKEINLSVSKNWKQIASVEFPPEQGKLGLSHRELKQKMNEYILRLQTWNLLNAWRNMHGIEAQSDELIRIFKLMNSNDYENEIYNKLVSLKLTSNVLRV